MFTYIFTGIYTTPILPIYYCKQKRKKQKAVNIKYNAKISKERTPNLA